MDARKHGGQHKTCNMYQLMCLLNLPWVHTHTPCASLPRAHTRTVIPLIYRHRQKNCGGVSVSESKCLLNHDNVWHALKKSPLPPPPPGRLLLVHHSSSSSFPSPILSSLTHNFLHDPGRELPALIQTSCHHTPLYFAPCPILLAWILCRMHMQRPLMHRHKLATKVQMISTLNQMLLPPFSKTFAANFPLTLAMMMKKEVMAAPASQKKRGKMVEPK